MPDDKPFPPPLPPRPLVREPFAKVKSDPPQPLGDTPAPESMRMRSTPPSGSVLLSREVEQMSEDPRDQMIRDLRLTNILYREKLTAANMPNTSPSPIPEPPKSRAVMAAGAAMNVGKYTALAVGVLGLAVQVASIWRPDLVGPLQNLLKLFGVQ